MLKWSLIFLVISVITGLLGFTDVSAATAGVAKCLFYLFLALFVMTLVAGIALGNKLADLFRPRR